MRCILILLDGLGDRAYKELDYKTPLQAARTPNLDVLAAMGANGLFHAARPGMALPSENAHFAIFGFKPEEFPGRGFLEALGAGIDVLPGEVALLSHFIHARQQENTLIVERHRPPVSLKEAEMLIDTIRCHEEEGIRFSFHHTHDLDGVVILRGDVSPLITDTDPLQRACPMLAALPWKKAADDLRALKSARALNAYLAWCFRQLDAHPGNEERRKKKLSPANALVTQRAGQWKEVESFSRRWGLSGVSISSGHVYWGLARYLGMKVEKVLDSSNPGADLAHRFQLARSLSQHYEFIHVHTKAPDAAAHTKDPYSKINVIESLDQGLSDMIACAREEKILLIITADHSTPSSGPLIHSGEPVPLTIIGPGLRRDKVGRFDEIHCCSGALGQVSGMDFMPLVLNYLNRSKLQGLMDSPSDQAYWPGDRTSFHLG